MNAAWDEEQMDGLQGHTVPDTNCITAEGTEEEWHTVIDHSLCPTASGPAPFISEKKTHEIQGVCGCFKVNDADLVSLCQKGSARAVCWSDQGTGK